MWLVSAGGGRGGAGETGYLPASEREGHVGLMVPPPGDLNLTFHILDFLEYIIQGREIPDIRFPAFPAKN